MPQNNAQIPVYILTGFLGSGKTTLLNRLLSNDKGWKFAVVENEIGAIGIDQELIKSQDEFLIELNNGCICCNVRDDVQLALQKLTEKKGEFDYLIIEATGAANPLKLGEIFLGHNRLTETFRLHSIITMVDCQHLPINWKREEDAFFDQIKFANQLILNKADNCQKPLAEIEVDLRQLNPLAHMVRTNFADVDLQQLLDFNAYDLSLLEGELDNHKKGHRHQHGLDVVCLETEGIVNPSLFEEFLNYHYAFWPEQIIRTKGILNFFNQPQKVLFQGVYQSFDFDLGDPWEEEPINKIVFIGHDLVRETLEKGFQNCLLD